MKAGMSGWLNKGDSSAKKFQKRWVELSGHQLQYTSKQGKPMEGMIDLHGVSSVKPNAFGKVSNCFTLETKQREWSFQAASAGEQGQWISAISASLKGLDQEHALVRIPTREVEGAAKMIKALEDLPEEAKAIVRVLGFSKEELIQPANFPILMNVLGFQTQQKFSCPYENPYLNASNNPTGGTQYTVDAQNAGRRWVQQTMLRTFEKTYKLGNKLGEGGYGIVFQAQMGKEKNNNVAIKKSENRDDGARATNLRELYYLSTLTHPSVCKVFDCFDMQEQGQMWAVLEYMDGGTLSQARKNHTWTPAEVAFISGEMIKAVAYLHSQKIIHRDIKSANVMFTVGAEVKLIDFGLATNFCDPGQKLKGMIGSPFWIAPEMIRGLAHDHKCDLWSTAMCLFELVNGHIPHYVESKESNAKAPAGAKGARAMYLIGTGVVPPYDDPNAWPQDAKDFFSKLMIFDPAKRPEAAEIISHPYLKSAAPQAAIKKLLVDVFRSAAMAMF